MLDANYTYPAAYIPQYGRYFRTELFCGYQLKVKGGRGYPIGKIPIYYRRRLTPAKLSSLKNGLKIG